MPVNPSLQKESTDTPIERANKLNDPQFENKEGYFPYDLTHQELMTPLFAKATPSMHLSTIPGDRIVVNDNAKVLLNQIDGNLLSQLNMYNDSFFVPLRSCFPVNYEKMMTNPTKGSDLPNSALPQIPFSLFVQEFLFSSQGFSVEASGDNIEISESINYFTEYFINSQWEELPQYSPDQNVLFSFFVSRLTMLATALSRGQLLDYLGVGFDSMQYSSEIRNTNSYFQELIDDYFNKLWYYINSIIPTDSRLEIRSGEPSLVSSSIDFDTLQRVSYVRDLSTFRSFLDDVLERGEYWIIISNVTDADSLYYLSDLVSSVRNLIDVIRRVFGTTSTDVDTYIRDIDSASNPFQTGHISLVKPLAYQQAIAQYYTNDSVDNIFNSQLYMQNIRAILYPSNNSGFSQEPTFVYNGVSTEYDYISAGGFYYSLLKSPIPGVANRQYVFISTMLLLRRTLRYGDKFATARPDMLAVGDINIPIQEGDNGAFVSPIDITQNLLKQRYLNAANYLGSGFLKQFEGMRGVRPSDTDTFPRFVGHRKLVLQNTLTNNTSGDQGHQTTNIAGFTSDSFAYDVFIDDFGVLIDIVSFDVMPVYTSGIDADNHLSDRFDLFNPMLQNIGDEPMFTSELCGDPYLRTFVFGYHMRNSNYKYKLSKAHGALVNDLPAFLLRYPFDDFVTSGAIDSIRITPEFIRDKPVYLDSVIPARTGVSPAQYFHFIVSFTNNVQTARLMQAQPPILF